MNLDELNARLKHAQEQHSIATRINSNRIKAHNAPTTAEIDAWQDFNAELRKVVSKNTIYFYLENGSSGIIGTLGYHARPNWIHYDSFRNSRVTYHAIDALIISYFKESHA